MLANPNKPVDLLCITIAQKYFIFVVLGLGHFVLPYAWTSVISVILVSLTLHLIRSKHFLTPLVNQIEKLVACGRADCCTSSFLGYITALSGMKNAQECTDNMIPFDRRSIRGNVRNNPAYRQ